ncbi:MAG: hypothetical protein ACTSPO_15495 [Candidatus Heimdallarchaeaceae archaeon]
MKIDTAITVIIAFCMMSLFVICIEDLRSSSKAIHELSASGKVTLYTVENYKGKNIHHLIYSDRDSILTDKETNNLTFLEKYYIIKVK